MDGWMEGKVCGGMGFPALQKEQCQREALTVDVFSLTCTDLYKQQGLQETLWCRRWFPALPVICRAFVHRTLALGFVACPELG